MLLTPVSFRVAEGVGAALDLGGWKVIVSWTVQEEKAKLGEIFRLEG